MRTVIEAIGVIICVLIGVAFLTLAERKVLASMHIRKGPNEVGVFGVLQPIADGVKLFSKETIIPTLSNVGLFITAPILSLALAMLSWAVIPFEEGVVISDISIGILWIFAVSSISVYAVLISGWASNSKYAFFGAIRAAAQMISYEVAMGIIIITVIVCAGELNLTKIVESQKDIWYFIPLWPAFFMFYVSALAETARVPFDLPEGESELVSGYNVEYSAMTFAMFFLAEYTHIIFMSVFTVILFFGGWQPILNVAPLNWIPGLIWLSIKTLGVIYVFIWVRGSLPRMRYDQLMGLLWKTYLPVSLGLVVVTASIIIWTNGLII